MMIQSDSLDDTLQVGRRLGAALRVGDIVGLVGPLGAGKTTLVRGIADGAGVADPRDVNSPTFVLVNEYEVDRPTAPLLLYHIDTYRLRHAQDLDALGFDEMAARGAVLIEWADRVEELLPQDRLMVSLEPTHADRRRIELVPGGRRSQELLHAIAS